MLIAHYASNVNRHFNIIRIPFFPTVKNQNILEISKSIKNCPNFTLSHLLQNANGEKLNFDQIYLKFIETHITPLKIQIMFLKKLVLN